MKYASRIATVTALAIALAACGKKHDDTTADNMATANEVAAADNAAMPANDVNAMPAAPLTAQPFVDAASASDAYEIAASKLAATKAADAGVKSFAAEMVTAHTKSTADLKAAASATDGKPVPAGTMSADQQANIAKLEGLSGADFDKEYVTQQIAAHEATLAAVQGYRDGGDSTHLKAFARKVAPVVEQHLGMVRKLAK